MEFYRLTRTAEAAHAFDGLRSAEYPGRWNVAGTAAVYAAATLSLAVLEVFVQAALATQGLFVYRLEVDDDLLERLDLASLPNDWSTLGGRDRCRDLAEAWRARGKTVGFIVPSAVVPEAYERGEVDVVFNPRHPDFRRVRIGTPSRLRLGEWGRSSLRVS